MSLWLYGYGPELQWVQQGRYEGTEGGERRSLILTPWKAPEDRPKG